MIIDCIESESRAQGNSTQQSEGHGQYGKGHASYKMCCQPFPDDDCPTKDRQHYATSSYKRKKHQWIALPENRKNSGEHPESILKGIQFRIAAFRPVHIPNGNAKHT